MWDLRKAGSRPWALKIALPVMLTLIVSWQTLHPVFVISNRNPFLLYFGVIFISAAYGGSRCAFVALFAGIICTLLFIVPEHDADEAIFLVATLIFVLEGLLITGLLIVIESAQQKLLLSEQKFKGIIESSGEGFFLMDGSGMVHYVSPSAAKLLGTVPQKLVNQHLEEFVHPDERREFALKFLRMLNTPGASIEFLQRVQVNGEWQWFEGMVSNLLQDNRVQSVVLSCRNVTARIMYEQKRENALNNSRLYKDPHPFQNKDEIKRSSV